MLASSYFNVHKTNRWFYTCNANNLQIVSKSKNCVVKMMQSVAAIKGWHWCKESKAYGFVSRLWQIQNITCVCINAETCNFTTVSEYKFGNRDVTHYTEKSNKRCDACWCERWWHQKSILFSITSTENILSSSSCETISLIESKEMGRQATKIHGLYQQFPLFNIKKGHSNTKDKFIHCSLPGL